MTFVNLAGIFVMLRAEFIAAVQIIVYTGAILVLVLFVIMLVHQDELPEFHGGFPLQRGLGLVIGLMLLGEFAAAILTRTAVGQTGPWTEETVERAGGNVQVLGASALLRLRPASSGHRDRPAGRHDRRTRDGPCQTTRAGGRVAGQPARSRWRTHAGPTLSWRCLPVQRPLSPTRREPQGEFRGGLVMVRDGTSYTDVPAFEADFFRELPDSEVGMTDPVRGVVLDGRGVGSEEE